MTDPEDEQRRLLGTPKNNLGRTNLPTLTFTVQSALIAETPEGQIFTGQLVWTGETDRTLHEALEGAGDTADTRTVVDEAAAWLTDFLTQQGGTADRMSIEKAGRAFGYSIDALKRARKRLSIVSSSYGFPRRSCWSLPNTQPSDIASTSQSGPAPARLTAPTAPAAPNTPPPATDTLEQLPVWGEVPDESAQSVQTSTLPQRRPDSGPGQHPGKDM